jgi:hypothetical protein
MLKRLERKSTGPSTEERKTKTDTMDTRYWKMILDYDTGC